MARLTFEKGSARVKVEIDGYAEIDKQLGNVDIAIRGKELKAAFRKSLGLIRTRARQLAPKPGYPSDKKDKKPLRDTIGVVVREYHGGRVFAGYVGPEYPAGAHGHLVEYGTKPHQITMKRGGVIKHPGSRPVPYMQPAAEEIAPTIEREIVAALQRSIDKVTSAS